MASRANSLVKCFTSTAAPARCCHLKSPGKNGKEKTINAYVLTGVSAFLQTGETKFDDKTARDVCKTMGCFNEGNHAYYLKGRGNVLGGSKDSGWTLTGPGLKLGAELIRNLAGEKKLNGLRG